MKCCDLSTEIPRRQEPYIKPWMPSSRAQGLTLLVLRNPCGARAGGRKYAEDIYASAYVDDCLIACKSKDIMAAFKQEILTRSSWYCNMCVVLMIRDLPILT
jgi:hypothetical protein